MYINHSFTVCLLIHFRLLHYFSLTMKVSQYFQTLKITHTMTCYIPEDLMLLQNYSRNMSCYLLKQHTFVSGTQRVLSFQVASTTLCKASTVNRKCTWSQVVCNRRDMQLSTVLLWWFHCYRQLFFYYNC
jgi:hypothetical protein